jgi:hypothetical protein
VQVKGDGQHDHIFLFMCFYHHAHRRYGNRQLCKDTVRVWEPCTNLSAPSSAGPDIFFFSRPKYRIFLLGNFWVWALKRQRVTSVLQRGWAGSNKHSAGIFLFYFFCRRKSIETGGPASRDWRAMGPRADAAAPRDDRDHRHRGSSAGSAARKGPRGAVRAWVCMFSCH